MMEGPTTTGAPRAPQTKGVEFSDHLTVFGPPSYGSTTDTNPSYGPSSALPKARVFVHRGAVANQEMALDPYSDPPQHPRSLSEHFEHTPIDEERPLSNAPSFTDRWERDTSSEGQPFAYGLSSQYDAEPYVEQYRDAYQNINVRTLGKRRGRYFPENPIRYGYPDDEQVETCTDSDISGGDQAGIPSGAVVATSPTTFRRVISDECFEESTRINTKLNSLPSGGTFSLMNSSEDITASRGSSSSSSSTDDERVRSSRKMVRVDGSAKLSSASGLADDDDFEFGIEDAEPVDEEEAVQVRSFGRSFAKVCLRDGEDVIIRDPRKGKKRQSQVSFNVESDIRRVSSADNVEPKSSPAELFTDDDNDARHGMVNSKSAPPRRRSKVRITFTKGSPKSRASRISSGRRASRRDSKIADARENGFIVEESDQEFAGITCFPGRKLNSRSGKSRVKSNYTELGPSSGQDRFAEVESAKKAGVRRHGTSSAIVSPISQSDLDHEEPRERKKSRQMVKNVSLQRDDWIEFATSAGNRQKSPWVRRLLSSNTGESPTESPAKRNSGTTAMGTGTTEGAKSSETPKETKRFKGLPKRRSFRIFWRRLLGKS